MNLAGSNAADREELRGTLQKERHLWEEGSRTGGYTRQQVSAKLLSFRVWQGFVGQVTSGAEQTIPMDWFKIRFQES